MKIAIGNFPAGPQGHAGRLTLMTECLLLLLAAPFGASWAEELKEPPVCSAAPKSHRTANCSQDKGALSVQLTARTATLAPIALPNDLGTITIANAQIYNGSLTPEVWELKGGSTLRVNLKNELTPEAGADAADYLTNLHTHGLIVKPSIRFAGSTQDKTVTDIGDNVFACTAPKGHEKECRKHGLLEDRKGANVMHYRIKIPKNHPEGLYWYHPHWHGGASSQVGRGLSGLIWIARPDEPGLYDRATRSRYIMLKDLQVENVQHSGQRWTAALPQRPLVQDKAIDNCYPNTWEQNIGMCSDQEKTEMRLFSVNGQVFPNLKFDRAGAEIWKIANTSANMTYRISLRRTDAGEQHGKPIPVQLMARDGVLYGVDCGNSAGDPRCNSVLLMPASRVMLYVARPADAGRDVLHANLITEKLITGPQADRWPEVSLMSVEFSPLESRRPPKPFLPIKPGGGVNDVRSAILEVKEGASDRDAIAMFPRLYGAHGAHGAHGAMAAAGQPALAGQCPDGHGDRLGHNQARLIDLDINGEKFLIGAGIVDLGLIQPGQPIPAAELGKIDAKPWDEQPGPQVCTHAGEDETWIIANNRTADNVEMHNFHIHQTKFTVLDVYQPKDADGTVPGFEIHPASWQGDVQHDTFPVPIGGWIKIRMKFGPTQVGDFVYHCHILEHEDGGMMAHVRVLPR